MARVASSGPKDPQWRFCLNSGVTVLGLANLQGSTQANIYWFLRLPTWVAVLDPWSGGSPSWLGDMFGKGPCDKPRCLTVNRPQEFVSGK